jgi:excisionase family DNA binding protein
MKIITIKELSELLKINKKTLYNWAELGQIPCIKLNGCLRFNVDDIHAWITSCKKDPDSSYNPLTQASRPVKGGDS